MALQALLPTFARYGVITVRVIGNDTLAIDIRLAFVTFRLTLKFIIDLPGIDVPLKPDELARFRALPKEIALKVAKMVTFELVPYVKSRVRVKTGRLKRSIRFQRRKESLIADLFYGAFQDPTTRQIVDEWFRKNWQRIVAEVQRNTPIKIV